MSVNTHQTPNGEYKFFLFDPGGNLPTNLTKRKTRKLLWRCMEIMKAMTIIYCLIFLGEHKLSRRTDGTSVKMVARDGQLNQAEVTTHGGTIGKAQKLMSCGRDERNAYKLLVSAQRTSFPAPSKPHHLLIRRKLKSSSNEVEHDAQGQHYQEYELKPMFTSQAAANLIQTQPIMKTFKTKQHLQLGLLVTNVKPQLACFNIFKTFGSMASGMNKKKKPQPCNALNAELSTEVQYLGKDPPVETSQVAFGPSKK